jgi:chromosome segregation ATPase
MEGFMKKTLIMVLLLLVFGLSACATKYPPPDTEISMARSAISQAEKAGAYEAAPVELRSAREKLNQAREALNNEDNLKAMRLAEQAAADANLAEVKARAENSRKALQEIQDSIKALHDEINRKSGS